MDFRRYLLDEDDSSSWAGTPSQAVPSPPSPKFFRDEMMNMLPSKALLMAKNLAMEAGLPQFNADKIARNIANYVATWSMWYRNVYNRVLEIVYEKTGDQQQAMRVAAQSAEKAQRLTPKPATR